MKLTNKRFKKIFILLINLSFTLTFILIMNFLLLVPINSKPLWTGSIIMFFAINIFYDINSIIGKLATLLLAIVLMTIFFSFMLNWSLNPSIYVASIGVSLVILLYMTFI